MNPATGAQAWRARRWPSAGRSTRRWPPRDARSTRGGSRRRRSGRSCCGKLADLLEADKDEFATIEVLDNGKPMWEAQLVDIALTIELLRYYGGWTTKIDGKVLPNSIPGMFTIAKREPVGVVAAITPWNFPLLEVAYKLGPALAAGCTIVIKPSELAPLSTLRLMQLVDEAGFPPGVINVVIGGPEVGASLVRHPGVQKVAFTGQTATGKEIMRTAVDGLKRVTLELGGKSPNIVFADAEPRGRRRAARSAGSSSTRARPVSRDPGCSSRLRSRMSWPSGS